jgi:hypothetical protein
VELSVLAVGANVDDAKSGLVVANPSCELDGGHVILLLLYDARKPIHIHVAARATARRSSDHRQPARHDRGEGQRPLRTG